MTVDANSPAVGKSDLERINAALADLQASMSTALEAQIQPVEAVAANLNEPAHRGQAATLLAQVRAACDTTAKDSLSPTGLKELTVEIRQFGQLLTELSAAAMQAGTKAKGNVKADIYRACAPFLVSDR